VLLREQEQLGSFLERPAQGLQAVGTLPTLPVDQAATAPGDVPDDALGPYRLVQPIGQGAWARSTWPSRPSRSGGWWP
jgi:hypothetical protein